MMGMKLSFTVFDSTGLEVTQESYNRLLADMDKLARECHRLEQLNSKAAKVITQCHSALSVLALGTTGSHIAQRELHNIVEGLTE